MLMVGALVTRLTTAGNYPTINDFSERLRGWPPLAMRLPLGGR